MGTIGNPSSGLSECLKLHEDSSENPIDVWHPSPVSAKRKTIIERSVGGAA